mmetsp:Transcript_64050/g.113945  ORF Transcript_64050/g.113945 Transcript_64050/m.113945 type:complete len:84 (-) Transcript_64050:1502-1753(-)
MGSLAKTFGSQEKKAGAGTPPSATLQAEDWSAACCRMAPSATCHVPPKDISTAAGRLMVEISLGIKQSPAPGTQQLARVSATR